ncbi:MAG: alpha/beta fold hydrolase [Gemmatimonadota bacterium]
MRNRDPLYRNIFTYLSGMCLACTLLAGTKVRAQENRDSLTMVPGSFMMRGTRILAEQGSLRVPERRANPASRRITLRFIRFASTSVRPGPPIVFLAGGPGDAATRAFSTMPPSLLDSLRAAGDVIGLDQRGTGTSEPDMVCPPGGAYPNDQAGDPARMGLIARAAADTCLALLASRGIDISGYTTEESAADIESLRIGLHTARISLLGASYGTHLGLAYLRQFPGRVARAVLGDVEGPDHTFKLPSNGDAVFARLDSIEAADSTRPHDAPRLLAAFDSVRSALAGTPARVEYRSGQTMELGPWDLQRMVSDALGNVQQISALPDMISKMLHGDFSALAFWAFRFRQAHPLIGMHLAMDCASYATDARLVRIQQELPGSRLGDAINFPMLAVCDLPALPRLPDSFRAPVHSDAAVLLVSGDLDGRTPPSNAAEVARGLPNAHLLLLVNSSHSLGGDEVQSALVHFLAGDDSPPGTVRLPDVTFRRQ